MKKVIAVVAAAMLLVGCSSPDEGGAERGQITYRGSEKLSERKAELSDGRTVTCISYKASYAGGLSCDWEGAR